MSTDRDVEAILPVTELQEGMLYHIEADPTNRLHWNQMAFTLKGTLDLATYRQAWQRVLDAEPALRAAFLTSKDGRPLQVIQRNLPLPWTELDWSELTPADQASAQQLFLKQDQVSAPSLNRPPLMRVAVAKIAPERHRVLWSQHHMIVDGWSLPLVLERVRDAYCSLLQDDRGASSAGDYAKYVTWAADAFSEAALDAWTTYLEGYAPRSSFPENPAGRRHVQVEQALDSEFAARLGNFTRRTGLTMATLMIGAWALTMAAETGQEDVVVGFLHADRDAPIPGIESMVGLAVRTLMSRFDTAAETSVVEWLQANQQQFGALLGQRAPLQKIVNAARGETRGNFFESLVVIENFAVGNLLNQSEDGWQLGEFEGWESTSYPLTLTLHLHNGMELVLTSNGSVDTVRGRRILCRLVHILGSLVDAPTTSTRALPWLLEDEPGVVASMMPSEVGDLLSAVRSRAASSPDKIAVVCQGEQLTYAALWENVLRVVEVLDDHDVDRSSRVAIHLERSPLMIAAILAVWLRNAAYVPLGRDYPTTRIRDILDDADVNVLLTGRPEDFHNLDLAVVAESDLLRFPVRDPAGRSSSESPGLDALAYVIFTSGSTGKPNGVTVSRSNVESFLAAMRQCLRLTTSDRMLAVTSVTFDIAVLELLLPLSVGAAVVLATTDQSRDGFALAELSRACSIMQGTPATWYLMLAAGWQGEAGMTAITGGEPLSPRLARELLSRTSELWNAYGPTEATVWVTMARIEDPGSISIGRPIAGTSIAIYDRIGRALPPGVTGELCIGGANVTPGYWRRAELTEKRFRTDHRLGWHFRTGDLALMDEQGQLYCLGREDHQVKLRGFRIELGDVETTLEAHAGVERACVLLDTEHEALRAFITVCGEVEDLREYLANRIPSYMIPKDIVTLAAMPLNASGKIDRSRLLVEKPAAEALITGGPQSEAEQLICRAIAEVLDVESVSRDDYFFNLGGHSLLAMKLINRVESETGVRLPTAAVVTAPIHEIASLLDQQPTQQPLARRFARALRGVLNFDKSPDSQ